jgi:hypothetical protein
MPSHRLLCQGQRPLSTSGIALKCISTIEGQELQCDIHVGECGHHSSACTLAGKAYRSGFYWPSALVDAAEMVKRYEACQFHAMQIHQPAQGLQTSRSLGRSLFGDWTSWAHFHERKGATATSSSPSKSSPNGQSWSPCARYRPGRPSSLSKGWYAASGCPTSSSLTT